MLNKLLLKFRKSRVDRKLNRPYILLREKDINKILAGGTVNFVIEEYVRDLMICTEEHYEKMLSEADRITMELREKEKGNNNYEEN